MKIISKFKDYYDGVVGSFGIDNTIIYIRNQTEFENDSIPDLFKKINGFYNNKKQINNPFPSFNNFTKSSNEYDFIVPFIVGFCGKFYVGWKLIKSNDKYYNRYDIQITYDFKVVNKLFSVPNYLNKDLNDEYNKIINYNDIELFRKYNTPIFSLTYEIRKFSNNRIFTINPTLKDLEFYKIFDSFTAFQEIQMFIGGVLGFNENDIIEIDDKYRIQQYGFDKWSFRKEPQNK